MTNGRPLDIDPGPMPAGGIVGAEPRKTVNVQSGHIIASTDTLWSDEPVVSFAEFILPRADGFGRGRYQVMQVIRNDHPTVMTIFLGSGPEMMNKRQIKVICGGVTYKRGWRNNEWVNTGIDKIYSEFTVAEAMEEAERLRNQPVIEVEPTDAKTWREALYKQYEEDTRKEAAISTFGYGGHIQR